MEGAAPNSVNYTDTLPLAIHSTQNRRSYYPQNGQKFTDTGSNIIRIDVNADGMLDVQQSYLEFQLQWYGDKKAAMDQGHAWIKRLTIESAGVILEDIQNYNRLVASILQPAQGSAAYTGEMQLAHFANSQGVGTGDFANEVADPTTDAAPSLRTATGVLGADTNGATGDGGKFTGQYHLCCGFLNMDKYLPLVLMGQGFTIQLEIDSASTCCVMDATGGNTDATAKIEISNVKYVAHIVEMARDFYDMLRNLQAQSGGSLMIGSSTYRHFSHTMTVPAGASTHDINISARVRSLESLLFCSNTTTNLTSLWAWSLSSGATFGATSGAFNVFVGAVRYPSNQIAFDTVNNKGQAYQELRKCFGALGSINHGGFLNAGSYLSSVDGSLLDRDPGAGGGSGRLPTYAPLGISFKSWRHELEDGLDTSSRALPIRLALQLAGATGADYTTDIYAQATILFYFNMDGSVTASV